MSEANNILQNEAYWNVLYAQAYRYHLNDDVLKAIENKELGAEDVNVVASLSNRFNKITKNNLEKLLHYKDQGLSIEKIKEISEENYQFFQTGNPEEKDNARKNVEDRAKYEAWKNHYDSSVEQEYKTTAESKSEDERKNFYENHRVQYSEEILSLTIAQLKYYRDNIKSKNSLKEVKQFIEDCEKKTAPKTEQDLANKQTNEVMNGSETNKNRENGIKNPETQNKQASITPEGNNKSTTTEAIKMGTPGTDKNSNGEKSQNSVTSNSANLTSLADLNTNVTDKKTIMQENTNVKGSNKTKSDITTNKNTNVKDSNEMKSDITTNENMKVTKKREENKVANQKQNSTIMGKESNMDNGKKTNDNNDKSITDNMAWTPDMKENFHELFAYVKNFSNDDEDVKLNLVNDLARAFDVEVCEGANGIDEKIQEIEKKCFDGEPDTAAVSACNFIQLHSDLLSNDKQITDSDIKDLNQDSKDLAEQAKKINDIIGSADAKRDKAVESLEDTLESLDSSIKRDKKKHPIKYFLHHLTFGMINYHSKATKALKAHRNDVINNRMNCDDKNHQDASNALKNITEYQLKATTNAAKLIVDRNKGLYNQCESNGMKVNDDVRKAAMTSQKANLNTHKLRTNLLKFNDIASKSSGNTYSAGVSSNNKNARSTGVSSPNF